MKISRRAMLSATVASGLLLSSKSMVAEAAEGSLPSYTPKPLPFKPGALDGISAKLIESHHAKNYSGAVKRLNSILQSIAGLANDVPAYQLAGLKREELIARNSMILHEFYFDNLGGDGKPGGEVEKQIKSAFGSIEAWEHDFKLTGQSLSGGSGWVILAYSRNDKRLHNVWSSDHTVGMADSAPILVMDMYEHSYQMDYGANAKAYIDAFFKNINWEVADKLMQQNKV